MKSQDPICQDEFRACNFWTVVRLMSSPTTSRLGCLWTAARKSAPSPAAKSATTPSSGLRAVANSTSSFARWEGVNISSINAEPRGYDTLR